MSTSSSKLLTGLPKRSPRSERFQGTMDSTLGSSRLPVIDVVSSSRRSMALPPLVLRAAPAPLVFVGALDSLVAADVSTAGSNTDGGGAVDVSTARSIAEAGADFEVSTAGSRSLVF